MKLLVVGPQKCGKTSISNYVSGKTLELNNASLPNSQISNRDTPYDPTIGARILEFEHHATGGTSIELWDVSGDQAYEPCWPAVLQGVSSTSSGANGRTSDTSSSSLSSPDGGRGPAGGGVGDSSSLAASLSPVDGVILVYDPTHPTHGQEIGLWYDVFVKNNNNGGGGAGAGAGGAGGDGKGSSSSTSSFPDSRVVLFAHRGGSSSTASGKDGDNIQFGSTAVGGYGGGSRGGGSQQAGGGGNVRVPPKLERIKCCQSTFDSAEEITRFFDDFVSDILAANSAAGGGGGRGDGRRGGRK